MRVIFASAAIAASLAISTHVSHAWTGSAELVGVTGKVLVNAGKGYVPAKKITAIEPGYEIFVSNDAGATVHFVKTKCDVVLAPASITRIANLDMCQQVSVNTATFHGTDGETVIAPVNGTIIPTAGPISGIIPPEYIAGGIFVINAAAFTNAMLEKNGPVSLP